MIAEIPSLHRMPITNKEAAPGAAMNAEIEDYTKALEVVKTYTTQDGLDVDTLLDSDKHGALTYNDFLVLPGYIGKSVHSCQFKSRSDLIWC